MGKLLSFAGMLVAGVLVLSCQRSAESPPPDLRPAFYHWKQLLEPDSATWAYLDSLEARRLYVRFFDVEWDPLRKRPRPVSILRHRLGNPPDSLEWVPVVFLTEDCLSRLSLPEVDRLAIKAAGLLRELMAHFPPIAEVQFDCDWTPGSREAYFHFLASMKKQLGVPVSTTLRLHQLLYPDRTGVPPADRAVVMYYNMGEVADQAEENSILNLSTGERYLSGATAYPLPLDLALPLFRWGVVFREGQLLSLINGLSAADLSDSSRFRWLPNGQVEVVESTYIDGYYLYAGDRIRLESVDPDSLYQAADQWASRRLLATQGNLIFYHLDEPVRKTFSYDALRPVLQGLAPSALH